MPYRLNPKNKLQIQVKRGKKWVVKYTHKSVKEARAQLFVLKTKVEEA